jgi:hypothetical protein
MWQRALWLVEIALVVLLAMVLLIATEDCAMREFKEYLGHPSPETRKAFQNKAEEGSPLRHKNQQLRRCPQLLILKVLYNSKIL